MLEKAYRVGSDRALQEYTSRLQESLSKDMEKVAWVSALRSLATLGGAGARSAGTASFGTALRQGGKAAWQAASKSRPFRAGKFMLGMGGKGAMGRTMSQWVAMPTTYGLMGAAGAEEGKRMEGFNKGFLGGVLFNVGMKGGEKLLGGAAKRLAGGQAGGANAKLFEKITKGKSKGNMTTAFGDLGTKEKFIRGGVAVGGAAGGMAGGMLISSAADPIVNQMMLTNLPKMPPPMTQVSNPFNPGFYRR